MGDFVSFLGNNLVDFWGYTGFANATPGHLFMLLIGLFFIYLAVAKEFEPMLLIPIGFGILIGNIPFNMEAGLKVGIYEEGSVLNILYQGVTSGWYPPLIFGYRSHDGLLGADLQPQIDADRSCRPIRYLRRVYHCPAHWVRTPTRRVLSVSLAVPTDRRPSSFRPNWLPT